MTSIAYSVQLDKPPTTPSAAISISQKRKQAIAAAITLLAELYPKCFSIYEGRRRPLKIGIHLDIQAALDGAIMPTELHRALGFYCSNPVYLSHLRNGAPRIDLEGKLAGAVSDDEAAHAREMLARIRAKREPRAAAARAAAQPAKRSSLADLKAAALARKLGSTRSLTGGNDA